MIGMIHHEERIIFCEGTYRPYSQTCRLWVMRRWRCSPVSVGIEYKRLYTYRFLEKACFYNTCSNSRPCASLHIWYRRSNDRPTRPSNRSSSSNSLLVVAPKEKNQGALNQAQLIATAEWGLTAQIISSAYINRWSVGSSAWRAHLDTCE